MNCHVCFLAVCFLLRTLVSSKNITYFPGGLTIEHTEEYPTSEGVVVVMSTVIMKLTGNITREQAMAVLQNVSWSISQAVNKSWDNITLDPEPSTTFQTSDPTQTLYSSWTNYSSITSRIPDVHEPEEMSTFFPYISSTGHISGSTMNDFINPTLTSDFNEVSVTSIDDVTESRQILISASISDSEIMNLTTQWSLTSTGSSSTGTFSSFENTHTVVLQHISATETFGLTGSMLNLTYAGVSVTETLTDSIHSLPHSSISAAENLSLTESILKTAESSEHVISPITPTSSEADAFNSVTESMGSDFPISSITSSLQSTRTVSEDFIKATSLNPSGTTPDVLLPSFNNRDTLDKLTITKSDNWLEVSSTPGLAHVISTIFSTEKTIIPISFNSEYSAIKIESSGGKMSSSTLSVDETIRETLQISSSNFISSTSVPTENTDNVSLIISVDSITDSIGILSEPTTSLTGTDVPEGATTCLSNYETTFSSHPRSTASAFILNSLLNSLNPFPTRAVIGDLRSSGGVFELSTSCDFFESTLLTTHNTATSLTTSEVTPTSTPSTPPSINTTAAGTTSLVNSSTSEILEHLRTLINITSSPSLLNVTGVEDAAGQILDMYNASLYDIKIAEQAITVIGNLGLVNRSVSLQVEKNSKSISKLRGFLDNYTEEVSLDDKGGELSITTSELHVMAVSIRPLAESNRTDVTFQLQNGTDLQFNLSLRFPRELIDRIFNGTNDTRIQFVAYKRSQLFVPTAGYPLQVDYVDTQRVISVSVKGRVVENLTEPVYIEVPKIKSDYSQVCAFWDETNFTWSREGVMVVPGDQDHVTCASNHLTSFAAILNVNEQPLSQDHEKILTLLTYIGCGVSMTCLVLTLVTYTMFKCLRNEKAGKILINLCLALLFLNVSFLAGTVKVASYSDNECLIAGMFLHYFVLASLMWMLVEAVELYRALVTVFLPYERLYLLKRCLVAWGLPVVIVGLTTALDSTSYYQEKSRDLCFLTVKARGSTFYAAMLTPACVIIAINMFVFTRVTHVTLKPRFPKMQQNAAISVTPSQVRGVFILLCLLGITWVFGPVAIGNAQTAFSYLFCICNSLQGCLIYIFRCLFYKEAKLAWKHLLHTGKFKSKRGPIGSAYSCVSSKGCDHRSTSSNVDSSLRSTTFGTSSIPCSTVDFHLHEINSCNKFDCGEKVVQANSEKAGAGSLYTYQDDVIQVQL